MQRLKLVIAFLSVSVGLTALFSGCASSVRPEGVTVTVADVRLADATVTETRVRLTLRYTSESVNAVGFNGSAHKLYFNGDYVGKAVSDVPFGLPPLTSVTQDVTMILENTALVRQLLAMHGNPVVKYRLESSLFTTTGEEDRKLKSNYEGTLDLSGLQSLVR